MGAGAVSNPSLKPQKSTFPMAEDCYLHIILECRASRLFVAGLKPLILDSTTSGKSHVGNAGRRRSTSQPEDPVLTTLGNVAACADGHAHRRRTGPGTLQVTPCQTRN